MAKKLFEVADTSTVTRYYLIYAENAEQARVAMSYIDEKCANDIGEMTNSVKANETDHFNVEDLVWDFDEERSYNKIIIPVSEAAKNMS